MKKYIEPEMKISEFSRENIVTESTAINGGLSEFVGEGIEVQTASYNDIFKTTE